MNLMIQSHIEKPFTTTETDSIKPALWLTSNERPTSVDTAANAALVATSL